MKNLNIALLLVALTFTACNKKTPPPATVAPVAKSTPTEKKAVTIDDLKGKKVEAKTLPADKRTDLASQKSPIDNGGTYKTYYENGFSKHNSGDFQGAISDFTKAIELNPQYSDAYNFRGMSRYKSGDKSGACGDWEKAASLGDASAAEMVQKYCK